MARTLRLWISDVIVLGVPGAMQRVPATYLAQQAMARALVRPFPAVFAAPTAQGPQYFVGLARMDEEDVADVQAACAATGARFRQLDVSDGQWDTALTAAQRTALNALLTGTTVPTLGAGTTRRQGLRRLGMALDVGRDDERLLLAMARAADAPREPLPAPPPDPRALPGAG